MSASFVSFVPPRARTEKPAAAVDTFRAVIAPTLPVMTTVPEPTVVPAPIVSQAAAPAPVQAPKATCTPSITLKREQDRITWIVVQCSCGEVTEIDCQYGAEG